MVKNNIKRKFAKLIALLILVSGSVTSQSLVETVQYVQYDEEYDFCPDNDVDAINAPKFFGGDTYFKSFFSGLLDEIQDQASDLKDLDIKPRSYSPSATLLNDAYKTIKDTYPKKIKKIDILLGENEKLVFCYEDGVLVSACEERHLLLFEATARSWVYSYVCGKWQAQFVDTAVRLRPDSQLTKVVFWIWIDIQDIDVNQCPGSPDATFADTALCSREISECLYRNGSGFVVGSYSCRCLDCSECEPIDGSALSDPDKNSSVMLASHCTPPKPPKEVILLESAQRYGLVAVSAAFTLFCLILALLVILYHSSQVIQDACPAVLLLVVFGAICKYAAHMLMLWPPSQLSCYLIPWLTEVSFVSIFPVISIKLQWSTGKVRKCRLSNARVLKYWIALVLFTALYMSSWTASTWSYSSSYYIDIIRPGDGVVTAQHCMVTPSNYVTQIGEVLAVCYGIFLCAVLITGSMPSPFKEKLWYSIVLSLEFVVSVGFYLFWPLYGLEGYSLLMATTVYYHVTVSLTVLLIFCPKLYYLRVGSKSADIIDDLYGSPMQATEVENAHAQTMLEQANQEIRTLKQKLARYENASIGASDLASPVSVKSKARGGVTANQYELEPLNISVNEKSF
ncbi:metabotropic glycine receptor-like [Watersipora subatra]|uniref:metabotropic glycine receptor-like n=1 Tax=Watersipora subatra TaxID=2589382 RepID=UPI00355B0A3F